MERRKGDRRFVTAVKIYGDSWAFKGADRRLSEGERREADRMALWQGLTPGQRNRIVARGV